MNENFESVDAGLTPDPFNSVTATGGNAAAASAGNGFGGSQSMRMTFAGVNIPCFGLKTYSFTVKLVRGYLELQGSFNIRDAGLIANQFATLLDVRDGATSLVQLRWVVNADPTKGVVRLFDTVAGVGVSGTTLISENTFFSIKIRIFKSGLVLLFLNGGITPEVSMTLAAPATQFTNTRVGVSNASAVPSILAIIDADSISIRHFLYAAGSGINSFDAQGNSLNRNIGIILGGEDVGIY